MNSRILRLAWPQAETEKTHNPNLLIEGFLDANGYIESLLSSNTFLILGPKGSGKTAIASKLELISESDKSLIVKLYYLEDFPYAQFSKLLPINEAPQTRYPNYWEFLLLISFLESFSRNKDTEYFDTNIYKNIVKGLQDLGLTPGQSLADMVKTVSKKEFRINIASVINIAHMSEKAKADYGIDVIFQNLRELCYTVKAKCKHMIIVDGLDDVLTKKDRQYESLIALIQAAERMNRKFLKNNVNSKVIILCRTDLFDKLPGPNKNKIKQDYSKTLDWYQDVRDVTSVNLVKLVNLRAKTSLKREVDIFQEFLPSEIRSGDPTVKTLLDNTRYRPRDFIHLLKNIQEHTKGAIPTVGEVWNGLRTYSLNYLIEEITDELSGYLTPEEIDNSIKLLGSMNEIRFNLTDLEIKKNTDERFNSLELTRILNVLFDSSAIGNVRRNNFGEDRYTMKYRNPYASFDPNKTITIHLGLCKALNIL